MHNCNFCKTPLAQVFADLGFQPPSNSFLTAEQLNQPETYYPLKAYVCSSCYLVQVPDYGFKPFTEEYPYYSSDSPGNVSHAKEFAEEMVKRFGLSRESFVLEIGSNDGYLLQWFKDTGCMVHGIDPSSGPVARAMGHGIPTIEGYFSKDFAKQHEAQYDLICGINVLAHQPDINDFVEGLRIALKPGGVIVMEFPWLLKTIEGLQFDQIYQEHYSYFSFGAIESIFRAHGLWIFDVEEIPLHGGSIRIYATQLDLNPVTEGRARWQMIDREWQQDLNELEGHLGFQPRLELIRQSVLNFLMSNQPSRICAYGAPAKASTFLNYCKVTPDLLPFTVDISLHKRGRFMPGSHIPILAEEDLINYRPDYVVILGWNIKDEIMQQLSYMRAWGGKFVVAVPELVVL